MSTNFPTSLDSYDDKTTDDDVLASHTNALQDAVAALEAKVGIDSSAVSTSHDYKITKLEGYMAYDTVWVPAAAFIPSDTSGAAGGSYEYGTNDVNKDYYAFDTSTEEYIEFSFPFPENWDRGTIKAKFYWSPGSSACTAAEKVEWEIKGKACSDDDAIDASYGTSQVISDTVLTGEEGDMHISSATPAITIGGSPALGDLIDFKVSRNVGSANDNMAGDAWLFGVLIQFAVTNTISAW